MNIVNEAIKQAVKEYEQNDDLAKVIISWFSELSSGNESIDDNEAVYGRLELLLKKIEVDITQYMESLND